MTRLDQLSPVKRAAFARLRARPASPAVTLRRGTREVGLVLVHPVGGSLLCYRGLLDRLPPDVSVVGFADHPAPTSADDPAGRIPRLAAHYLKALSTHDTEVREWVFAGWSFGGAVALEMAFQSTMDTAAPQVKVVMLDTDPHGRAGGEMPSEETIRGWFVHDAARLASLPEDELGIDLADPELADRYQVFAVNARGLSAYRPGHYAGPVSWVGSPRPAVEAWRAFCPALTVHGISGSDHYTLLAEEHVGAVARVLALSL